MPNIQSAKKRLRQNVKRRARNQGRKARLRTAVRGYREALAATEVEPATERLKEALKLVDKGVKQRLMHRNAAARKKSRLTKKLTALTAAAHPETAASAD
ncbi:MAG: 30S ribosomal protein S20 [Armatimonadetes bacterium CG_4_10_14_3_um_filter_66_18]|nr:30S ribosomal protein S20 [Armatimonadota bacterium]OIO95899.1 MAG: 30S ribosomal protein S20 [Armatimonadetes bacterium CG2_30_66_41]PIU88028.1 MAG: 30S ribosomal protein S20 [Armatimonadetes bacterium CG06_land_8_20_14_3_00_66_21]PIX37340.1 MAG: 30S ribosomal protein S20 [Armatimonadetes bacterium CG_4_8_14_3_um_filter_66_20]PIY36768.1 MAG: 30S ribosomal protein S20 [Armatimonadetes bacterium CG_4_10_14_3_um_filter_66_18]PIZ29409.1 MAG: 30S ribosomal protein S20 [Armatimonadetes bacterium